MNSLKLVFTSHNTISVNDYDDIEEIKESIKRKEKWIEIDGFYINLDNVEYIVEENNS